MVIKGIYFIDVFVYVLVFFFFKVLTETHSMSTSMDFIALSIC